MKHSLCYAVSAGLGLLLCAGATASAGTYKTIAIDGSFSDWSDVPIAATDAVDNAFIDFTQVKLANDANYLYILLTFAEPVNPQSGSGVYTAIDSTNDNSLGYDVYGLGVIHANTGFQNDFPFTESAGVFNSGGAFSGAAYLANPYNLETTEQEIAMPLGITQTDASAGGYSGAVFPSTFGIAFWSEGSGNAVSDITPRISYSLAAVPEPGALALLALGGGLLLWRRGRRTGISGAN